MKEPWLKKKWVVVLLHIAFWSLLFFLPYLLQPSFKANMRVPDRVRLPMQGRHYILNIVKSLFWISLFYMNAYVLIPKFFYPKKFVRFSLCILLAIGFLSGIELAYFHLGAFNREFHLDGFIMFNLVPFLLVLTASTAYRMYQDKEIEERKGKDKEAENLKSELSFLRSQISPHFMFNVLNNIVSLARKNSPQVEPSLLKLSGIMRYFLYENTHDTIALEKELDYLRSYIDLQEQRFGDNTIVKFNVGPIDKAYEIEPMLLIPFVENAFKHGIIQNGSICVALKVADGTLQFTVKNRYRVLNGEQKDETSGIGLTNIKRRLNLLYAKRHSLLIDDRGEIYTVSLQLKLH